MSVARWLFPIVAVAASGCATTSAPVEQSELVIRGPQKPVATQTAKKPAVKPAVKSTAKTGSKKSDLVTGGKSSLKKKSTVAKLAPKTATPSRTSSKKRDLVTGGESRTPKKNIVAKLAPKTATPSKTSSNKRDLVTGGESRTPKKSIVAKLAPRKVTLPKVAQKITTPVSRELPSAVFEDANALVVKKPVPQPVLTSVATAISQAEPTLIVEPLQVIVDAPVVAAAPLVVAAPVVQAAPAPTYVVTTLTDTTVPIEQASPSILRQAALPPSVAVPQISGPKPMKLLTKFEQSGDAPNGSFGFMLLDAQTGEVLSEKNADTLLPPASIAKMLPTIAILEAKGLNGTFRTSLLADGSVSGGVLNGDLHLVGGGDPSLNRGDLSGLARRLASAGVRKVNGQFFYHGDSLPEVSIIDRNQSVGAVFNPGISALNLGWNEHRGSSPVKNPSKYTAEGMRRAAQSAGVSLPAPRKGSGGGKGNEIASHDSAPLSVILTEMFDVSRNITAEVLGAVAAVELSRKPTSLKDAARLNAEWAKSTIGPIGGSEWIGFELENNSGLSKRSKVTPRQMAAMTHYGYKRFGQAFKNIHESQSQGSSGGVDYAIATKFGTLSYVRGTTGFITLGGRDMVFVIMANDPQRRLRSAKGWNNKARRLEQAIISDWLQNNWPTTRTASR